jgi:lysophospholipase L1-like esterase/dienelactone hydrolase
MLMLQMPKRRSLMMLGLIAAMAGFGPAGSAPRANVQAAAPAAVIKSANDPTKPVPGGVRWFGRKHASYVEQTKNRKFDLCLLGDSITDMWPGDLFGKYFGKYNAVNFGIGGDRCENVLWRLENGELKGTSPKVIVLLIGTNNSGMNTAEEMAVGITAVVKALRTACPETRILLLGVFPKKDMPLEKGKAANAIVAKLDDGEMIRYLDIGSKFLDKDGKIQEGVLSDVVHLTRKGYEIWAEAMNPLLAEMMISAVVPVRSADTNKPARVMVWDVPALSKTPKIHETKDCPAPGMRAFFYEGADYKGKPTWVFAYYSAPEGKPPAGGWPAAVCSHGGGGTAYPDWVKTWNEHGYAAISMDQEGHLPDGKAHENAGPARISWFGDIKLPDQEQWFYQAVADVIRANSLLRSFPEINPDKIGLTGISWGGTIVSSVAGVDSRFAFVVPVYGCGFVQNYGGGMTGDDLRNYLTKWDPSIHLPYAKMPMLWMTGFDDPVFPIDIFERSACLAAGPSTRCYRGHMLHGHGVGWKKPELYVFADSIVKGTQPLPSLGRPEMDPKTRLVRTKTTGKLVGASLYYTTDGGQWKGKYWTNIPCDVRDGEAISRKPLPECVKAYNVNAKDNRDLLISSEIVFLEAKTP